MVVAKAGPAGKVDAEGHFRRLTDAFDRRATRRFIALTIGLGWLLWFSLRHADYADFNLLCNHDPAAALRTDEIVALGARPGVDFFYYYGALPIVLGRVFFSVFGRSPLALCALLAVIGAGFSAGLARMCQSFNPTRFGVLLIAVACTHVITPPVPTHSLEAALLIWAVASRIRVQRSASLALCVCAIFVKISMGSVLLCGFVALTVFDAIRERSSRPLVSLLTIPCAVVVLFIGCSLELGHASVLACFDPRLGARLYKAGDLGFLRQGRQFWYPAGHTLGWYFGGLAGPWIAASTSLLALGPRAIVRLVRGVLSGTPHDPGVMVDETYAIACVANLAFIVVFFGPAEGVSYYAWVPLVGVAPLLSRAHCGSLRGEGNRWTGYRWLALAAFVVMSTKGTIAQFVNFLSEPRVWVGAASMPVDEAIELRKTLSLAHATGRGTVTVVARAANFGLVDPTLREGRYWMMQAGMGVTPSVAELLRLAQSSDALLVSRFDYPGLMMIPEFQPLLSRSARIFEGKYFFVLSPTSLASSSPIFGA